MQGHPLIPGQASGPVLVSDEPLSFWGGYDQFTGEIIDRRHPLSGQMAKGCILAIPATRGSSTTTAVLLEAIRGGMAPIALLTSEPDHFLALACIVADEMYGKPLPLVVLQPADFATLQNGRHLTIDRDGKVR